MEGHLQIHHIIPRVMFGSNERNNAVGLCGDGCHRYADAMILYNGIPFELLPKPIVVFEHVFPLEARRSYHYSAG
jgi:hypothetical protein